MTNKCPTFDFTCPYYDENNGNCTLENPEEECDDFGEIDY
jgi:hypothetical protein